MFAASYNFELRSTTLLAQLQRITVTSEQLQGQRLFLSSEQSHYLRRVLRLREGDRFIANAPAHPWLAELSSTDLAPLLEALPSPAALPVQIHLLAALPKTGFDEVVRQSTELGVGSIWPVLSDRTLLKPSPKKLERWHRIAQEASEQCERSQVPKLHAPAPFEQVLTTVKASLGNSLDDNLDNNLDDDLDNDLDQTKQGSYLGVICAARSEAQTLRQSLNQGTDCQRPKQIAIAIGPEGGWTETEIQQALSLGYVPVSLGPTILRAVTAPLAAIAQIMSQYCG